VFSASPRGEDRAAPIAPRAVPSRAPGNLASLFLLLFAGYAFVVSVPTERGFVPHLVDPGSDDERFLGVDVKVLGVRTL
jgi:hypothetical protein